MANNEIIQALLEMLETKYGDLTDNNGCYSYNARTNEYEWFSIAEIVSVINEVDEMYDAD